MKIEIIHSAGTVLEEGKQYDFVYDKHLRTYMIQEWEDGELLETWLNDLIHDEVEFKIIKGN